MGAHTTSDDPTRYRLASELEAWKLKDPLERMKAFLYKQQIVDNAFYREQGNERRHDTNAHDDHLRRDHFAIDQLDAGDMAVLAGQRRHPGAEPDIDPMRTVLGLVETRQRLAGDPRQHAVQRLDYRHLLAELDQRRGRLEPDIATADHHRLTHAGHFGDHPVGIGLVAYRMYAGEIMSLARDPPRAAARRPDHRAITDARAVGAGHLMPRRVDRRHRLAEQHRHAALGP